MLPLQGTRVQSLVGEQRSHSAAHCSRNKQTKNCLLWKGSLHSESYFQTDFICKCYHFHHSVTLNDIFLDIIFYCLFTLLLENINYSSKASFSLFPNVSYQGYSFLILILFYHLIGLYGSYPFRHATSSKTVLEWVSQPWQKDLKFSLGGATI